MAKATPVYGIRKNPRAPDPTRGRRTSWSIQKGWLGRTRDPAVTAKTSNLLPRNRMPKAEDFFGRNPGLSIPKREPALWATRD